MESGARDEVVAVIGETGRWQVRQSVLISLVGVICSWHVLSIVFLAPTTEHTCVAPAEVERTADGRPRSLLEATVSKCHIYLHNSSLHPETVSDISAPGDLKAVPCSSWTYDSSQYVNTVITEWDLVCERHWQQMLVKGAYMVGILFGVLAGGFLADRYGRRPSLLVFLLLDLVASLACAGANHAWVFIVARFFVAFFDIAAYTTSFVLAMELFGDKWRALMGTVFVIPLSIGFMILGGLAYLVRHWRWLQLATSLPGAGFIVFYWLVPESPRWLLSKGRVAEANGILETICKYNGTVPTEKLTVRQLSSAEKPPKESMLRLLRNPRACATLAVLVFCWFVNSFVFYGIVLQTGVIGGNSFLNATLGGLVEIPSVLMCTYAVYRVGRRAPISLNMIGAGVACLLTLACNRGDYPNDWPMVCLALMGRFCITGSFTTIYIYTAELFPTSVRNSCLACCSAGSRLGGILAPYLELLRSAGHPAAPVLLFGGTAISSGLSIFLLRETARRPLPEVVADMSPSTARRQHSRRNTELSMEGLPEDTE